MFKRLLERIMRIQRRMPSREARRPLRGLESQPLREDWRPGRYYLPQRLSPPRPYFMRPYFMRPRILETLPKETPVGGVI